MTTHNPAAISGFQSTLPLRGATVHALALRLVVDISIHAPLAGSDHKNLIVSIVL